MNVFSRVKALVQIQSALGKFQSQIKGQDMKNLLKNWKTTLAGLITLGVTVTSSLHLLTDAQTVSIVSLATAFGLFAAKDGNVTGGTTQQ